MADQELIEAIRNFARRELAPAAGEVDRTGDFPADHWKKLGEVGLTGLVIPEEHGGLGGDAETVVEAFAIIGGSCAATAWALLAHSTVASAIAALGSEAQKAEFLPALANADKIGGTLAGTETGGGSNPGSIRTTARDADENWVLDGAKFFMSQGSVGDVNIIMARSDDKGAMSCFISLRDDPGVEFGPREGTMGLRGLPVCEIRLEGSKIPKDRLIGPPGGAMAVVGAVGLVTLLGSAAAALGIAEAAFAATVEHLKSRLILGQPLSANPAVQAQVARLASDLDGARARLGHALAGMAQGFRGPPLPMWFTKVAVTESAADITRRCLQLHGAVGYSTALPLERHVRDVLPFAIHWGNNESLMAMAGGMLLAPAPGG